MGYNKVRYGSVVWCGMCGRSVEAVRCGGVCVGEGGEGAGRRATFRPKRGVWGFFQNSFFSKNIEKYFSFCSFIVMF